MRKIKTEIILDDNQKEPKVLIITDKITEEIKHIKERLTDGDRLNCYGERGIERVLQDDLIRIYAESGSVYAVTASGTYLLHERLYETEKRLEESVFVRISKSEIVNSRKILRLNVKLSGTIGIELENGIVSFVSRRYVPKIKEFFGL